MTVWKCVIPLLLGLLLTGCAKSSQQVVSSSETPEELLHLTLLQRHLTRDVKESGPDGQSTYSGFLDDGRVFVATQDDDSGTCMVTTPQDAQEEMSSGPSPRSASVEPIFLVEYRGPRGDLFWEITQNTKPGDVNYVPPSGKQAMVRESCDVNVVFH